MNVHRHLHQRAALHYLGGGSERESCDTAEREDESDHSAPEASGKADRLLREGADYLRPGVSNQNRTPDSPQQYMVRYETAVPESGGGRKEGLSPQSAPSVCPHLL